MTIEGVCAHGCLQKVLQLLMLSFTDISQDVTVYKEAKSAGSVRLNHQRLLSVLSRGAVHAESKPHRRCFTLNHIDMMDSFLAILSTVIRTNPQCSITIRRGVRTPVISL